MNRVKQIPFGLLAAWLGRLAGTALAFGLALLAISLRAPAAEANLTTTEISQTMREVVTELGRIPSAETQVASKVQNLQREAQDHFLQSTNTSLNLQERNRHYALALDSLAKATIESDKFANYKGAIISSVKGRLGNIQAAVQDFNPTSLPAIDRAQIASQNQKTDEGLAKVIEGESVPEELAEDLAMAKTAAGNVEGLANDSLVKFRAELKSLWHQVLSEEFKVAQGTLVDRRVLTWIQLKAMQGQLGLARASGPTPGFNSKGAVDSTKTLIQFSAPHEPPADGSADGPPRRVTATAALLQP